MAKPKLSLDDQIKKFQEDSWSLAEKCSTDHMKLKDRIYETGLMAEEAECMKKIFLDDTNENKLDYLNLLAEMRVFYTKIARQQESF